MSKSVSFLTSKRKIAIFGIKTYPALAGADRVVENILNNIDDEFEYFIYLTETKNKISCFGNKHFIYLPYLPGKHLKAFSYFLLCSIHIFLKKYDLIHAHNSDIGLFTFFLSLKYRRKIIGTFHGNPYERSKWNSFAKFYLKLSEKLFVKSCSSLTSVADTKTIDNANVKYIPNGIESIDIESYKKYNNKNFSYELNGLEKGCFILFACGRLDRTKGLHYLIEAYDLIENNALPLVVIGDFNHDKEYSKEIQIRINNINKKIIVVKQVMPKEDLFDIIINSAFVVFPSEIEAMSMLLLEVLACKKAVVCSDIDENVKVVGINYQYLFRSKSVESLLQQIQNLLANESKNDNVEPYANTLLKKLNWISIVKEYDQLYKNTIVQE